MGKESMNKIAYGYGTLGTVGGMGLEYQELKPLQIGDLLGREVRRSFRTQRDSVLTGLERTAIGPHCREGKRTWDGDRTQGNAQEADG